MSADREKTKVLILTTALALAGVGIVWLIFWAVGVPPQQPNAGKPLAEFGRLYVYDADHVLLSAPNYPLFNGHVIPLDALKKAAQQ